MLLDQEFTASDVAQIADVKPENLQLWLKRGLVVAHRPNGRPSIEGGGSQGKHRRFRWYSVMEIAFAGQLIGHGFPPSRAFEIAVRFAHVGGSESHWEGEAPSPIRLPGLPYHHSLGETFVYTAGDHTFTVCEGVAGQSEQRARHILRGSLVYTVVAVSSLFNDMCARLGVNPYDALNKIYPDASDRAEPASEKGARAASTNGDHYA